LEKLKNVDGSVMPNANTRTIAILEIVTCSASFHKADYTAELGLDKKICCRACTRILEQILVIKLELSSRPADLFALRHLRASECSELEMGREDRNLEDNETEGRTPGHGLLYSD
jgi:hypothetical protein